MNAEMEVKAEEEQVIERPEWTKVWVGGIPGIQAKLDKINKRAAKLGVGGLTLVENRRWTETHKLDSEGAARCRTEVYRNPQLPQNRTNEFLTDVEFAEVKVVGGEIKLAGWTLVARVEPFADQKSEKMDALFHCVPGQTVPEEFKNRKHGDCDHCHKPRTRRETFILRHEDGRYAQVGRNCIRDFLGHADPDTQLWMATAWMELIEGLGGGEDGWEMGGNGPRVYGTRHLLAVSAAIVEAHGYVSAAVGEEKRLSTTRERVAIWFDPPKPPKGEEPVVLEEVTDAHYAKADLVHAWVLANTDATEYFSNLRLILSNERVQSRHLGYAVSAVSAYNRAMDIEDTRHRQGAEWADKLSKLSYLGEIGKRQVFEVKVISIKPFDSEFGTKNLINFEDAAGNMLIWWASGDLENIVGYPGTTDANGWYTPGNPRRKDELFKIKATVKEHKDYKGAKQTVLSRVSALD